jgi:hypothetical protein
MRRIITFIIGQRPEGTRLTIVRFLRRNNIPHYECRCDCGKVVFCRPADIGKKTFSCGCLGYEKRMRAITSHGLNNTPEYQASKNAFSRCYNPHNAFYSDYGGRGITCDFGSREEMAQWLIQNLPKPHAGLCLDRIDNSGGYSIGNLKWSTPKESSRNTRKNRTVTINGVTKCISEWSEESGIGWMTLLWRIEAGVPGPFLLHKGKLTRDVYA